MAIEIGDVLGVLSDNLRRRGSVLPLPARKTTRWARGLGLPRGGSTVLYTGQMYQLVPYIQVAVAALERVGDTRLAALVPLGRRLNRLVNGAGLVLRPSALARAPYDRVLVDVVHLLRRAGVEFGYLYGDDLYSGALAHDLGLDEAVAAHARRVHATLRRHGVTEVITVDPHTTNMLRSVYPTMVEGFDLRVRTYLEVLAERAPVPTTRLADEVALHDPCVFARYENVLDQPRTLLAAAGVTVREPAEAGRSTRCCGGPVEALYPRKALAVAQARVHQLREVAGAAVTMCPLCLVNLDRAVGTGADGQAVGTGADGPAGGTGLAVTDISAYLRRAYAPSGPTPDGVPLPTTAKAN